MAGVLWAIRLATRRIYAQRAAGFIPAVVGGQAEQAYFAPLTEKWQRRPDRKPAEQRWPNACLYRHGTLSVR